MQRLINKTRGAVLADGIEFAVTPRERRRGLIGRDCLEPGRAMVFRRCRQVHTFGMRFPIDVVFIDPKGMVVRACRGLGPRRLSPVSWRASTAVELPEGTLERSATLPGDLMTIE